MADKAGARTLAIAIDIIGASATGWESVGVELGEAVRGLAHFRISLGVCGCSDEVNKEQGLY